MGKNLASEFPPPPSAVNGSTDNIIEVDDYTNWSAFFRLLEISFWATVDSVLWTIINVTITFLFIIVCPWWAVMQIFLKVNDAATGSAVSQPNTQMYRKYLKKLKLSNWSQSDEIVRKLDSAKSYDYDLSEFFLHLSAIVYEPSSTVSDFLSIWASRIKDLDYIRFGREGCCILAVFSVEKNFIVFAFKGTSPFDLCEWLTDASMRKSSPSNGVLPGLVHTGFYSSFGYPEIDYVSRARDTPLDKAFKDGKVIDFDSVPLGAFQIPKNADPHFWCSCVYPNILAIRSRFAKDAKPNFWITGHSLGAATASIFTSIVLWSRSDVGKQAPVPTVDWDNLFRLRGTYTYGTPRIGDTDFKRAIEKLLRPGQNSALWEDYQFYRTINSDDIVCSVPGFLSQSVGAFIRDRKSNPYTDNLIPVKETDSKKNNSDGANANSGGVGAVGPGGGGGGNTNSEQHTLDRPSGVTLLDFQHVGKPVLLGLRDGTIRNKERAPVDFTKGMIMQVPTALYEMVMPGPRRGIDDEPQKRSWTQFWMLVGVVCTGGTFGLLKDHYPSEYIINLEIARRDQGGFTC